jgi:hypothetical protein
VWDGDRIIVSFGDTVASGSGRVAEFGLDGGLIRELQTTSPVRTFVAANARRLLAVAHSGALIEVPR